MSAIINKIKPSSLTIFYFKENCPKNLKNEFEIYSNLFFKIIDKFIDDEFENYYHEYDLKYYNGMINFIKNNKFKQNWKPKIIEKENFIQNNYDNLNYSKYYSENKSFENNIFKLNVENYFSYFDIKPILFIENNLFNN